MKCFVVNCKNRSDRAPAVNVIFHGFPRDPSLRDLWIVRCGHKPGVLVKNSNKVCSVHFLARDYKSKCKLYNDAAPSLLCGAKPIDKRRVFHLISGYVIILSFYVVNGY